MALHKIEVMESDNELLQNYNDCLSEAQSLFLAHIFQGKVFKEMELNPLDSTDQQYGVPYLFNEILEEL